MKLEDLTKAQLIELAKWKGYKELDLWYAVWEDLNNRIRAASEASIALSNAAQSVTNRGEKRAKWDEASRLWAVRTRLAKRAERIFDTHIIRQDDAL